MEHDLLAFCARPALPDALAPELRRRAARVADWQAVLELAEQHGLGPLLHRHLRAADADVPTDVQPQLAALHVRHRRANEVHLRALGEILDVFRTAGIEARVLKGPALMFLVYRDPALRPVSDLDILVRPAEADRAQELLATLGFRAASADRVTREMRHHLPAAIRASDGIAVQVELHRDALARDGLASIELDARREAPVAFDLNGHAAVTLGPHEMLWQICEHLVGTLPRPLRLIWIADVIGVAETFGDRLDWTRIARDYSIVLNVLGLAQGLTPLPERVAAHVPPRVRAAQSGGGAAALSWRPRGGVRAGGRWRQFRRTISPPAWWIGLRYGGAGSLSRLVARLRYVAAFARAARRRMGVESVSRP